MIRNPLRRFGELAETWKLRAKKLKREVYALYLAVKDPRAPWYARVAAATVVGYAMSPIDLIPDFIPILGYLDDLILIPLGIMLVIRLMPVELMDECRNRADAALKSKTPHNWVAGSVIITIWALLLLLTIVYSVTMVRK